MATYRLHFKELVKKGRDVGCVLLPVKNLDGYNVAMLKSKTLSPNFKQDYFEKKKKN